MAWAHPLRGTKSAPRLAQRIGCALHEVHGGQDYTEHAAHLTATNLVVSNLLFFLVRPVVLICNEFSRPEKTKKKLAKGEEGATGGGVDVGTSRGRSTCIHLLPDLVPLAINAMK